MQNTNSNKYIYNVNHLIWLANKKLIGILKYIFYSKTNVNRNKNFPIYKIKNI